VDTAYDRAINQIISPKPRVWPVIRGGVVKINLVSKVINTRQIKVINIG
jgi:hypothetical protein